MGGGRCYYRNCKVNCYNCPGMHFFRFPLKDETRCGLWIKYSHQYDLYALPLGRQRNLTLCGRHFRDECFMNFKKDRLIASAVPTIHRLAKDKALDYELEINHGVLVTLPEADQSHLIAPTGFECPLGFGFDATVSELLRRVENERSSTDYSDDVEIPEPLTANLMSTIDIPADREGIKRSANFLLTEETLPDEGIAAAKRSRQISLKEDDFSSISDDTLLLAESTEVNSQPTIISHQIMDAQGHLWLQSEPFSLQEGSDFEFEEMQPGSEHSETEQIQEIAENEQEEFFQGDHVSITEYLHLSHKFKATSVEIDDLRFQLKTEVEKAKKLQSKLSASRMACTRSEQQVASLKIDITEIQNANDELTAKSIEAEILKVHLEEENEQSTKLEKDLSDIKQEHIHTKNYIVSLKGLLAKAKRENDDLKKDIQNRTLTEKETKQEYDQQMQSQQLKHLEIQEQLLQQIRVLEGSMELAQQQLTEANSNISSLNAEYAHKKSDGLNSAQKVLVLESQLQKLQELYDDKDGQYTQLEISYESLRNSNEKLKTDYKSLESNQNQVSTVTTSNSTASPVVPHQQPAAISTVAALTKAQLFNGIKRYISSSMCSLLRMEMFGSVEREWKPDERQIAVDLLRLGESVYKYLTDEWRFRLPALRDVRNWLSQSVALDDEEDV